MRPAGTGKTMLCSGDNLACVEESLRTELGDEHGNFDFVLVHGDAPENRDSYWVSCMPLPHSCG